MAGRLPSNTRPVLALVLGPTGTTGVSPLVGSATRTAVTGSRPDSVASLPGGEREGGKVTTYFPLIAQCGCTSSGGGGGGRVSTRGLLRE